MTWAHHKSEGLGSALILAETKLILKEKNTIVLEIITCDPSIYTMDHPDLIVCGFMEDSIDLKRVNIIMIPLPL